MRTAEPDEPQEQEQTDLKTRLNIAAYNTFHNYMKWALHSDNLPFLLTSNGFNNSFDDAAIDYGIGTGSRYMSYLLTDVDVPSQITLEAIENDYQKNIRYYEEKLKYCEENEKRANDREQEQYWMARVNGLQKRIEIEKQRLKETQDFRTKVLENITPYLEKVEDWFENTGDIFVDVALQRFPPESRSTASETAEDIQSVTESELPPALGLAISAGRGMREKKHAGGDIHDQMREGVKDAIISEIGSAAGDGFKWGVSAVGKELGGELPRWASQLNDGGGYAVANEVENGIKWFLDVGTKKKEQPQIDFGKEEHNAVTNLILMSHMARKRKEYIADLTDQLYVLYNPTEWDYRPFPLNKKLMNNPYSPWNKERIDAAEQVIYELWETLSTEVPVEDALEANKLFPMFSILIMDLEKKRTAGDKQ